MKGLSEYPVLDNRPIDQWKVTELKEELKRRKLITRGLKEDLVRRLDEAIRADMEAEKNEAEDGLVDPAPDNLTEAVSTEQIVDNTKKFQGNVGDVVDGIGKVSAQVDSIEQPVAGNVQEKQVLGLDSDLPIDMGVPANDVPSVGLGNETSEHLSSEKALDFEGIQDGNMEKVDEGSRVQEQFDDVKQLHEDVKLDSSDSTNQVSEVSSSLGFPVKSNSISTDSLSFNEKNDLKDNIIADNDVKLESDVKPEMVQPSSSDFILDGGKSHPSDVEEPHENKVSVQETDNNVTHADVSQKNYSADLGSEKLNLDRSSGDDSMEEDALESKHIDSNYNSEEVVEKTEKNEVITTEEGKSVATMDVDVPGNEKGICQEKDIVSAASADKRKLSDKEVVLNNEPSKRQRRWKSESNDKETQVSNISSQAPIKEVLQPAVLKRNLSGSNSIGGSNEPPKEREVPPSSKAATNSLRIDRFLRPFTLKAVQELLGKTGTVTSFWMDHIKTHCYVTYSSVEEATETRNAVYDLQWPPNGGRHLIAEFVDPEEVKLRLEPPPPPPLVSPVSSGPTLPELQTMPQPSPRQKSLRQQMQQQPTLPPPPPLSNPPQARERAILPPPPPPPPLQNEKVEAPIVTLDDLFKKTKATPRIYYLPLSEEEVSAVLEARRRNAKQ